MAAMLGEVHEPVLSIANYEGDKPFWGEIEEDKIRVTCVPKDNEFVREYFPNLPEMEYKK